MGASVHPDRRLGRRPAGRCRGAGPARRAYTLLELQVTLVILATGVLGVSALLAVQGRQIRQVEAWCREAPTYYLLTHTNRWMRRLEAGAELHAQAGQTPWSPPVAGHFFFSSRRRHTR